ncbi:VlhA.4.10 variable lipoprotein family protein [Mycoplasmoides gallisepticum str. R(low)]|uniref:VlhA.4.10 variable lipoprotein family protein n=4 Tax=Mycoplasmoides gallisepticum TaxID=2096 RepID=Q7NBR0_MYCGA|nr:GA module-containing protein [Mycoplasmoides gallisepticum]AAP56553.1 VlhA.4.10 variable lipoprotein family protein [Mycoplasmoides gallisepticum str. R(low)]ADC30398.1 VlhA.4.10 variable lipoprotein family protein [Mycoplasmoides gallisepticum str. R(high)]
MKRKNILKFVSLLGIGSFVMLAAASCTQATTPTPNPNPPSSGMNGGDTNPGNGRGMDNSAQQLAAAKTEAKVVIDASAELSDSVKEALKRQVDATTTGPAARDLKTKAEALVSAVKALSGSVTAAKTLQSEEQYTNVSQDLKTTLEAKLTAATELLEDGTKLKNLDASSNLDTTKASLESSKTDLDAAVATVKPELDFQKTKTSAASAVEALDTLVNSTLKAELQRQVTALDKDHAAQATTMLENLTSLKESLESLQTLVSNGLKMQVDYPRNYYDADNKTAFDDALLKASSVFPAFKWTAESIMVPAATNGALRNPRAWTKARDKSEFKLQNFVMAPAQADTPTTTQTSPSAIASAIVKVATGTEETSTMQTAPAAQTPTANLASTASYLKSLNDTLKAATDALNGDNPTTKTAYYKADAGRTLYWDGFMPKIVTTTLPTTVAQMNREYNESPTGSYPFWKQRNALILTTWFNQNQDKLSLVSEQLTKKLGEEKFKNMTLSDPKISWDESVIKKKTIFTPKVTFTLTPKEGYKKADDSSQTVTLTIRNLYKEADPNKNLFATQGASSSAAPQNSKVDDANVKAKVNVYLNYTGPNIELDAKLLQVGSKNNTSINGTSNVDGNFNTKFKELLVRDNAQTSLLQAIINYVNKFDPKFKAQLVTEKDGVAITKVQNIKELRIGNLNDSSVFLQQVNGDSSAVYFAVNGVTSEGWLNTFLIRIPLTKFVRPISVLQTPDQQQTKEGGEEATQPQDARSGTASTSEAQSGQSNEPAGSETGSTQQAQSSPTTGTSSSSN